MIEEHNFGHSIKRISHLQRGRRNSLVHKLLKVKELSEIFKLLKKTNKQDKTCFVIDLLTCII